MDQQPDHSPWYQPRTAEIIQRGGEGFANSIGAGIQNFAQGIAAGMEKKKEEEKTRAREFKALAEYGQTRGYITKDQATTKDLDSLRGLIRGKEAQSVQEEQDLKKRQIMQQIAQEQQSMGADAAFGRDVSSAYGRNIVQTMAAGNGPVKPPAMDYSQLAAGLSPQAWQSKRADPLLNYHLLAGGPGGKSQPSIAFNEDPETGVRFATYGNVLQPSGVNPKRAGSAVTITGPDGQPLGVGLPGKGGITPLNTGAVKDKDRYERLTKQLTGLIASQGKVAYSATAAETYQKQIDEVVGQIHELENAAAPASGAPATTRYKMVNGKLVPQ